MIQLNLLPDVKLEYIKATRTKRAVVLISIIVSAVSFAIFLLLFLVVNVQQKTHMNNLNDDIAQSKKTLQEIPDLSKKITVQNQLNSLGALHSTKPVTSRAFTYIQQLTPQSINISNFTVDFVGQTIEIEGGTDNLANVNTFVDTLKFTNYTTSVEGTESAPEAAFSEVVLAEFALSTKDVSAEDKPATYKITLKFNPLIFGQDSSVKLLVDSKVTTRSQTERPESVFRAEPTQIEGNQ